MTTGALHSWRWRVGRKSVSARPWSLGHQVSDFGPAGSCADETVGHADFYGGRLRESKLSRPATDRLFRASSYALENRCQVLMICHAPVSPCAFLVGYGAMFPEADHETVYCIPRGYASSGLLVGKLLGCFHTTSISKIKLDYPSTLGNSQFHSFYTMRHCGVKTNTHLT